MSNVTEVFGKGFSHKVTVYVPRTVNVNEKLSDHEANALITRATRVMSETFGGATIVNAAGAWVANSGELVTENTTLVYSFTDSLSTQKLLAVRDLLLWLKATYGQEAVAIEIDNELFFV